MLLILLLCLRVHPGSGVRLNDEASVLKVLYLELLSLGDPQLLDQRHVSDIFAEFEH